MRKKTLGGLLKLADWNAKHSNHELQAQRNLRDQALREHATVQQYIAAYDNVIAGDEYSPALLAHKRLFVSRLHEQLTQIGTHVEDCDDRLERAYIKQRADSRKVVALQQLRELALSREILNTRRLEQLDQDEVAARSSGSSIRTAESLGCDHG